ncbi:sensor histidine kinase [Adhaeribacter radiodurans]|uniref:histidine kinase n=1 Tax=Adhaeribacter radiodurans TaxID=2745197 RepID=A0A7L7L335_9BACT|nr:HAMP domain-containing sensor histidine kinase [Adhaeribacter radiodurans]QMU27212.1 HAMP domain-containing histidine kinase [Adhaeribacter radiodurans]
MKSRSFPYIHLIAAVMCFAAAALLNLYTYFSQSSTDKNVSFVADNITKAISAAEQDVIVAKTYLREDTVLFSKLLGKTQYPCFIMKGDQLIFWSDHTTVTDFDNASIKERFSIVESKHGKYLVNKENYQNFSILLYIPLEVSFGINNNYLQSGLNEAIFGSMQARIITDSNSPFPKLRTSDGTYLFSLQQLVETDVRKSSQAAIAVITLGIGFLVYCLIFVSQSYLRRGSYVKGLIILIVPLFVLRLVLLYFNFPFSVLELEVFNPKLYAASFWSPSIGDLLLNAILLAVLTFNLAYIFRHLQITSYLKNVNKTSRILVKLGCAVAFYVMLHSLYVFYLDSFTNSLLVLDVSQSLDFSFYKFLLYTAFILHTAIFFIFVHLLTQIFHAVQPDSTASYWYYVLTGSGAICVIIGALSNKADVILFGLTLLFFVAVIYVRFRRNITANPYQTYLFIFWIIGMSSVAGSLAMYVHYQNLLLVNKQKFASGILLDNDIQGEYLLNDISLKVQADPSIRNKFKLEPFVNIDFVKQKIERYYLRDYFDKYEVKVRVFDANGMTLDREGLELGEDDDITLPLYLKYFLEKAVPTEHEGLFLIKEEEEQNSRKYIQFIRLRNVNKTLATIVLELNLKKLTPYSVIPELLVDQKFFQPLYNRDFSYAFYQNKRLTYNEGDYNYIRFFSPAILDNPELKVNGLQVNGYHHLGFPTKDGKILVVTTAHYSLRDVASNFSALFLVHTFCLLLYMLLFLLMRARYFRSFSTNFSTKIQLYLNFGILIPLVLISIATASLVTGSYRRDLEDTYNKRGKLIQENFLNTIARKGDRGNQERLGDQVRQLADLSETDINLYDNQGKLLYSSQPLIFDAGLLSRYINPEAFVSIEEGRARKVLLQEQAGNIRFNALYLPLYADGHKESVKAFIGLPFFDSEKELDSKLIELFTTIMNIFTSMFIVFMVLTYVASRALTVPLKLVTQKLKQTTLTGQNEKLDYHSADEIGLLVSEYNNMLLKLEESKKELATREKEAAWREMARQVAHEIKNPLTPMKLSLQYLQKAISEKRENTEALISKISGTLITQINTLSDIATSFSNFTTLPDLKPEKINIAGILQQCAELHQDANNRIQIHIPEGDYHVFADESLMVRTFNNLLINALQAIPAGRTPCIWVSLQKTSPDKVLISVQDNGSGIPAEICHKVFIPNFSTKFSGSGIGLAVAKRGIESAGGRIWFHTTEDQGTTFFIQLPAVDEA